MTNFIEPRNIIYIKILDKILYWYITMRQCAISSLSKNDDDDDDDVIISFSFSGK
jgi:hypothetical protein